MPKWYTSPVVAYERDGVTTLLPAISSRVNHVETFIDSDGTEHRHYYEERAYTGRGLSFAYSSQDVGAVCLVRVDDTYHSRDADGAVVTVENPIPSVEYATPVTDFSALVAAYPSLAGGFIDQPSE